MQELSHIAGVLLALGAAVMNAVQSLCIRKGTQEDDATRAVLVVMLVNVAVLLPCIAILYYPHYGITPMAVLSFAAAGLLGTMLGRALMYTSIAEVGVSRTVPIIAGNALVATLLGAVFLGESLTVVHGIGIVLIVSGVAIIARETNQEATSHFSMRSVPATFLLPIGAAVAYGWEPIFANFGFAAGTPAPVGLVLKTLAATIGFVGYLASQNESLSPGTLRSRNTRWFILAGIANTLFLLGYYTALVVGSVNVVVPIVTTNTLWAVVLSAFAMPNHLERVTWQLWGASLVVVVGVAIVSVVG